MSKNGIRSLLIALAIGLSEGTAADLARSVDDLVRAGHDRRAAAAAARALAAHSPARPSRLASSVFMPRT